MCKLREYSLLCLIRNIDTTDLLVYFENIHSDMSIILLCTWIKVWSVLNALVYTFDRIQWS